MKYFFLISFIFSGIFNVFPADSPDITRKLVDFGHKKTLNRKIDVLIIHSVYNASGGDIYDINLIIKQFRKYHVSSHYLIGRDGTIYQLVQDNNIAFHAGKGVLPDGSFAINTRSVGIELANNLTDKPTDIQFSNLISLVKYLQNTYHIKFLLRHSDIAPDRKTDPWNFDWNTFLSEVQ